MSVTLAIGHNLSKLDLEVVMPKGYKSPLDETDQVEFTVHLDDGTSKIYSFRLTRSTAAKNAEKERLKKIYERLGKTVTRISYRTVG